MSVYNFNYSTWTEGANLFSTLCQEDRYDDAAYLMLTDISYEDFDCEDRLRFHGMYESKIISPCNPYLFSILKMSAEPDYKDNIAEYLSKVGNFLKPYNNFDIAMYCCTDFENDMLSVIIDNFDKTSNKIPHRICFRCLDRFLNEDKTDCDKRWIRQSLSKLISKAMKLHIKIEDYADEYVNKIYSILSPYSIDVYFMMVAVFGEKKLLGVAEKMANHFIEIDDLESGRKFIELCEGVFNCQNTSNVIKPIINIHKKKNISRVWRSDRNYDNS
jgi:hypothetical protein